MFFTIRFEPEIHDAAFPPSTLTHYSYDPEPIRWRWWTEAWARDAGVEDLEEAFFREWQRFQIENDDAFYYVPPHWPVDHEVLFGVASPIRHWLPALAAHAYLSATQSDPHPYRPTRTYTSPSGEEVGPLTESESFRQEAVWQLEVLGWVWDDERRVSKRDKAFYDPRGEKYGVLPEELRSRAIATLAVAWHDGGPTKVPAELVERVRLALRWFFLPDELTEKKVEGAIRNPRAPDPPPIPREKPGHP